MLACVFGDGVRGHVHVGFAYINVVSEQIGVQVGCRGVEVFADCVDTGFVCEFVCVCIWLGVRSWCLGLSCAF